MLAVVEVGSANSCLPLNDCGAEITSEKRTKYEYTRMQLKPTLSTTTPTDVVRYYLHVAEALARRVQVLCVAAQYVRAPRAILVQLDLIGVR